MAYKSVINPFNGQLQLVPDVDDLTIESEDGQLKLADRIENNIMLLAFYRAVDNSKTIFQLDNGFMDEYEDESGIDTVASIDEVYNSTDDYYTNNAGTYGPDVTTSGQAISSSDLGGLPKGNAFDNNTGTLWACGESGVGIPEVSYIGQNFGVVRFIRRFTIRQNDSGNRVKDVYLDYSDNGSDWTTLQTITNVPDSTGPHTYDTNDGGSHQYWRLRVKEMHQPATTSWNVYEVEMMEGAITNNMTLISESQTADVAPDQIRMVLFEEDISTVILNTDIKAYVSSDDGVTWAQITLQNDGKFQGNKQILSGVADMTQSGLGSGTDIIYKITTHDNKEVQIHACGMNWG